MWGLFFAARSGCILLVPLGLYLTPDRGVFERERSDVGKVRPRIRSQ